MKTKECKRSCLIYGPATVGQKWGSERVGAFFLGTCKTGSEFFRSQTARLSRIATKMRVPLDQVEDVPQEVWLDAIRHRKGFHGEEGEKRLSTWLAIVVRNKSMDALRRLRRRRTKSLDELGAEPVDLAAEVAARMGIKKEKCECLATMLEELRKKKPLNHRLLCGRFLEGRSIQVLADETGLGTHAISCRISRTIKQLRSLVEPTSS